MKRDDRLEEVLPWGGRFFEQYRAKLLCRTGIAPNEF
jgi:hypothetical protein